MKYSSIPALLLLLLAVPSIAQDGKAIFNKQCKACHSIGDGKKVGPDLQGVTTRRDPEWIAKFILSSKDLIASGDKDAVALFEEYKKMPMPSHNLSQADISGLLTYIIDYKKGEGDAAGSGAGDSLFSFTPSVETGRNLFTGSMPFENGGASCISCHSIRDEKLFLGGTLAKDLTVSYSEGIVETMSLSIPAMISSFKNHALTSHEKKHLEAFLKNIKENQFYNTPPKSGSLLFLGGFIMFVLLFLVAHIFWKHTKKTGVKDEIYKRQVRSV